MNYEQTVTELEEYFTENQETDEDTVIISISELEKFNPEISDYFLKEPEEAKKAVKEAIPQEKQATVIKFTDLPDEDHVDIKDIGAKHIGNLIAVEGLMTNIEDAKVEPESAVFKCTECGDKVEKDQRGNKVFKDPRRNEKFKDPYHCEECKGRRFDRVSEEYFDVQNFTISAHNEKLECRLESEILDSSDYQERQVISYGVPEAEEEEVKLQVENIEKSDSSSNIENTEPISDLIGNNSAGNPETILNSLTPLDFEKLIARIFEAEGWETELTGPSEDQEIDIIARKRLPMPQKFLIQAKYYEESKVTPKDVHQYNSLKEQEPNTDRVIMITSSTYTDQAKELARSLDIKTFDRDHVIRLINQIEQ